MKYIKTFENAQNPQIGDYVICNEEDTKFKDSDVIDFVNNNVGQFISFNSDYPKNSDYLYIIYYENAPKDLLTSDKTREMSRKEIIHFSKDKNELEAILNSNKYNL